MKNNNYKIISAAVLFLIFGIIFFTQKKTENKYLDYENYLLSLYQTIPNYTKKELDNIPKPEHPHLAGFQNTFMTIDPFEKRVPIERLHASFRNIKNMPTRTRNIQWNNVPSLMGGRTRTVMFDPNDSNYEKIWAGSVTGGLWYNNNMTDENSNWIPVSDLWDNISISKIVYDPNNPMIFYVGTGEANTALITYRESSSKGIGIWKTEDAGITWQLLPSTNLFEYIVDIEIKNENGQSVVYAAVASGEYYGTHESLPSDGLFRSIDHGESWEQVLPNIVGLDAPYTPSDIKITSNGRIFVGTMKNLNGDGGATILYSDTGNIGSWNIYNDYINIIESDNSHPIPGRVRLESASSNGNIVYAIIGSGYLNSNDFNLSHGNYILKSVNAGLSWNEMPLPTNEGSEWASLAWHALGISVHPNNPNIIFCGGLELYRFNENNWNKISDWSLMYEDGGSQYVHADIHDIVFRPDYDDEFVVVTDGGVFYSNNINDNSPLFTQINNYYTTLQFYTCDIHPTITNYFIGGLQDNGTVYSFNSPIDLNNMISGGDGAYCFFDDDEPLTITSTYYNRYYFFSSNFGGGTYEYVNGNSGVFINPADYDSENNILYANATLFNGTNANRIIKISNTHEIPILENIDLNTNTGVYFSHVKLGADDNLYLGTQSGKIYIVNNLSSNPNATEITGSNMPIGNISSIDFFGIGDTISVTFSNYGVPSVWITENAGSDWQEVEGNLPDMPIRWIVLHPDNPNHALIATEIGVWETSTLLNNGVVWSQSSNGMPNVRVDMLQIRNSDNMVLAASHGKSLFYGQFNIEENLLGDINYDGSINIQDIILIIGLIINNQYDINADINNDNELNILDILIIINIILD